MSLLAVLTEMGATSREVAMKLEVRGCTGRRDKAGECPVSAWLRRCGYRAPEVLNAHVEATWGWRADIVDAVDAPPAIAAFVTDFDGGAYPWLEIGDGE